MIAMPSTPVISKLRLGARDVEPAATARAAGHDPNSFTAAGQAGANVVEQLGPGNGPEPTRVV